MDNTQFYGYKHWTSEDSPRCFYVGKGRKHRPHDRVLRSKKWKAVVLRFGLRVEICAGPVSDQEAIAWEIATIEEMQTFTTTRSTLNGVDIRCNFTRGGDGASGYRHTEEQKTRISQALTGRRRKPHTDDARQKMSLAHKGVQKPADFGDKIRRLRSRAVQQLNDQGHVIAEFASAYIASQMTNTSCAAISMHCRGKRRLQLWRFRHDA